MDITAKKLVARLIREGQTWERSGLASKAQKAYQRAIRIYDTFLFWPFFSRQTAGRICGAIARFQANAGQENPGFNLASTVYLKWHPEDDDVALPWLNQLRVRPRISSLEQEVLTVLARQHDSNTPVRDMLADIFLRLERKDFTARKLYRQVAAASLKAPAFESRIEALVGPTEDAHLDKEPRGCY